MEKKYTITCDEKHLRLIAKALEQHSRIICGQLGESYMPALEHGMMKEHYYKYKENHPEDADNAMSNYCAVRENVENNLAVIKQLVWKQSPNASYGIGYDKEADYGYETYKTILSFFEDEKMKQCEIDGTKYSGNVHTGEPLKLTDNPRMEIKILEE